MHGGAISKEDVYEKQMTNDERRKQLKDEQANADDFDFQTSHHLVEEVGTSVRSSRKGISLSRSDF